VHTATSQIAVSLTDVWGVFGELFGDFGDQQKPAMSFGGGATALLKENLQADFSFGVGLSSAAPEWFVSVGVSIRLPH